MPRPTIAEVSARCDVLEERSTTRHAEIKELFKDDEKLLDEIKTLRVDVTEMQKEIALFRQRLDEHLKRVEKWDTRFWGLIVVLMSALLSLSAGLIVVHVKK